MGPTCTHRAIENHAGIVWLAKKQSWRPRQVRLWRKQTCILVEEDVPGAALPRESIEECSVVQLKRWLTCKGTKTSRKKSSLVYR